MRPSRLSLLLIAAPFSSAKNPASWGVQMLPSTIINTSAMRDRSPSILVSGNANNVPKLNDIIGTCKNQQGGIVPKSECQSSVLSVGMSMGLAVLSYRSATFWAGAFGPNGNNKRALEAADDFFSRLPDHLSVSNIKVHGTALPASPLSSSFHRRKSGAEEYNVFYNGSLPLTFMVHHTTTSPVTSLGAASDTASDAAETEQHVVPLFAATDGAKMWLTHITPIAHVTTAGTLKARSGFNGYNHVGAGGIKLLANSDPVAAWADTTNWLNGRTEANGFMPYDYVRTMADTGTFVGHSLMDNVHDASGWGFNGQFSMEGINHAFSPDWEGDFNWCFGAYPTNC